MAKKDLFDSIDVPAPCPQSWDAMIGDEKARFCGSCEKDIHNLSELTRYEVKKLLFQSEESVCVRMEKDADGRIKTLKKQIHQITRQMPMAAGILSASLTLSAVTQGQKIPQPRVGKMAISRPVEDTKSIASISGTVSDEQGAVIPNMQIILRNTKNKSVRRTTSNNDGFYEFKNTAPSVYEIRVEAGSGFLRHLRRNIKINGDKKLHLPIVLKAVKRRVMIGIPV